MEIILSDYISWQYFLIILVFLLFVIWLFFGRQENLQYIGLSPLKIGVDATRNVEHERNEIENVENVDNVDNEFSQEENLEVSNEFSEDDNEELKSSEDNNCEDLTNFEEKKVDIFTHAKKEFPVISISESFETKMKEKVKSPRSLALGNYTCYKNDKKSKGELLCKKAIEDIYGVPFYCVRPDFLKNPETGRNLELDLYNDDLKIAVEYNGIGHYEFPNPFHKTREDFINQLRRDQFKIDMCDKHGIYLITVPYNVANDYETIRKYIEYYLPENHSKRLETEN